MLNYTQSPSPFYFANEKYCKQIESELNQAGINYRGRCDAWGYEILADFESKKLNYHLQCLKQQSTGGKHLTDAKGVVYAGIEINGTGFDRSLVILFEKNSFLRLFMSPVNKKNIPAPYFFKQNIKSNFSAQPLIDFSIENQFSKFKIKNGRFKLLIHVPVMSPLHLISEIELLLSTKM
jgi:hypothetical protein